jgi:hypothetical protein
MNDVSSTCSKCGGNLVQGFSMEYMTGDHGMIGQWIEGEPTKSWLGLGGVKGKSGGQYFPIAHFRCAACGFLESYARPEFAMQ